MKFNVVYFYIKKYLPSQRHKKVREHQDWSVHTVEILEINEQNFPVAFITKKYESVYENAKNYADFENMEGEYRLFDNIIRTYNGKLYSLYRVTHGAAISIIPESKFQVAHDLEAPVRSCYVNKKEDLFSSSSIVVSDNSCEQESKVEAVAKEFVYFEGAFWRVCTEPRYVVMTFGLGHNHGGTSLFITDEYNSNVPNKNYFSALHRKEAIEYGKETALARGDTEYVSQIENSEENIEVYMPEMVKVNPETQHGNGCEFMNHTEELIRASSTTGEAGILCMLAAFKN